MKKTTIFVIAVLVIGLIFVSGCADQGTDDTTTGDADDSTYTSATATDVKNIQIANIITRDSDSDNIADGLEFEFKPMDKDSNLVESAGTFEIWLWETDCENLAAIEVCGMNKCLMDEAHLLEYWFESVTESDYDPRPKLLFNYAGYEASDDDSVKGCAKVVFTTPDGSKFETTKSPIYLNK